MKSQHRYMLNKSNLAVAKLCPCAKRSAQVVHLLEWVVELVLCQSKPSLLANQRCISDCDFLDGNANREVSYIVLTY